MYQTLNAVFHSFLNKFQRDSGCLRENSGKQTKVFLLCTGNNAGFPGAPHPTCSASSSLIPKQRQHSPSRIFSILPAEHSQSLPCPQEARQRSWPQAGLASWLWPPHRDLPVPSASHQPCSLIPVPLPAFPETPHNLIQAVQLKGRTVSPDLRGGPEFQYYSQIYREGFDSNILLSLQAQNCVC